MFIAYLKTLHGKDKTISFSELYKVIKFVNFYNTRLDFTE